MSDAKKPGYKPTLNLPKTSFDMRAGLLTKEPALQESWRETGLYAAIREARAGGPSYVLHDGPPYANGNIHMGTALNKVLKDIVVRIRTMEGFDAPYLPGWDCHGLPIEQRVMEELGDRAASMTGLEIRAACRAYADKYVKVQSEQFQRLGVIGEFETPYITMDPAYEAATLDVFTKLVEKGLVYRQLKPIHWSIENRTALADAELEYHDRQDSSIFVFLPLATEDAGPIPHEEGDEVGLLIWTTTPWTLPANRAVAVHPGFTYAAVRVRTPHGPRTFLVAEDLRETVLAAIEEHGDGWMTSHETLGTVFGQKLLDAGLRYRHPLVPGRDQPVVPAHYVTLDQGTGLVHTAPGHGLEDHETGLKHGLEVACPVKADGTFSSAAPAWLRGESVWDANPLIVEHLRDAGHLALTETITHSYPHDWRSKGPTILRATEQWFIAVDRDGTDGSASLRAAALDVTSREDGGGVEFLPQWGRNRMRGMLESRPDWCISRQRYWGLPIPVFYNEDGRSLMTPDTVRAVANVFREHGADCWYELSPAELLAGWDPAADPDLENPDDFPVDGLTPGNDIFDVWFESGSSWNSAALQRGLVEDVPVDLYLEGSDQHRGWFQLSLLPSLGAKGRPPFATILTHGFVVTEDGHKMSKSLGNAIDVTEQLDKRGADVIRLWLASQNYQDDVRCSENLIAQAEDAYRKIRNTLRFCMGSCGDFDPAVNAREPEPHSMDVWMRTELHRLIRDVRMAYDRFEFHRASRLLYDFCTVQASSVYLNAAKDRLYCDAPNSPRRRSAQTVIHETLVALIKLLAPVLPHTCEEAWNHVPSLGKDEPANPALALLPEPDAALLELADLAEAATESLAALAADPEAAVPARVWPRLMELRSRGLEKLEAIRNAGVKNALDTEVAFRVPSGNEGLKGLLETYCSDMEDLLGVGFARVEPVEDGDDLDVVVTDGREKYERCARSWKRRPDVGSDADYPDVSARDAAALREIRP
jgi:isoleucyl-tRNA synthetase